MKKNYIYGAAALVVVAVVAGVYFYTRETNPLSLVTGAQPIEIKPTDQVHGQQNAPVTIVEYASMTCPHCAAFQKEVVPELTKDYIDTGKVKVIFREYPLDGAARMASAVARCLSGDKYFAFIDLLFANQVNWVKDFDGNGQLTKEDVLQGLEQMGRQAGMSKEQVDMCAESSDNLKIVDANWMEGMSRYNVDSTPTFIINGVTHAGEIPYADLKKIIDPMVAKAK